jgi:hypothetical protein
MLYDWPITLAALVAITALAVTLGYWAIRKSRD